MIIPNSAILMVCSFLLGIAALKFGLEYILGIIDNWLDIPDEED